MGPKTNIIQRDGPYDPTILRVSQRKPTANILKKTHDPNASKCGPKRNRPIPSKTTPFAFCKWTTYLLPSSVPLHLKNKTGQQKERKDLGGPHWDQFCFVGSALHGRK